MSTAAAMVDLANEIGEVLKKAQIPGLDEHDFALTLSDRADLCVTCSNTTPAETLVLLVGGIRATCRNARMPYEGCAEIVEALAEALGIGTIRIEMPRKADA